MESKVLIDPTCKILYSSFYIKGLYKVFGKENVSFSAKYFHKLKRKQETDSFDHYLAFVVVDKKQQDTNVIIDFRDKPTVNASAYNWADKYAKINFNSKLTSKKFHGKMIPIPPAFGIQIWNLTETTYYCFSNLIKSNFSPVVSIRKHIIDYCQQYLKPRLPDIASPETDDTSLTNSNPYIFFNSKLWQHDNCIKGANLQRKNFIELCKSIDCTFEGGFFAKRNHPQYDEYRNLISYKRDPKSYFKKIKSSTVVFNTPAVHDCHGWKLGEFLSMGKAIISTPPLNELPVKLEHGKNIHIITSLPELKDALTVLLKDDKYRKSLETGAKEYYLKYGKPESVIDYILKTNIGAN